MPRRARIQMSIIDVVAKPSHTNDKGIKVEGTIIVSVRVKRGRFSWNKAYGFLAKDLKEFTIDELKNRVYKDAQIWIKEKELEVETLKKLQGVKGEAIFLD